MPESLDTIPESFRVKRALDKLLVGFGLDIFQEEPHASPEVVYAQNQRSASTQV